MNRLCIVIACLGMAQAVEWGQFRGPGGDGKSEARGIATTWSETEHITWRCALPGRGWSSPVIAGDRIWMTTAYEVPETDEARLAERLEANTGGVPLTVLAKVKLHALCVDRVSGRLLHDIPLLEVEEPQWVHQLNSYASPTPILADGRVYTHFGTFGSVCLEEASGEVLWTNDEEHCMHENGPGGSAVLAGDHVIFHLDGSDTQHIVALHKDTGKRVWKTARSGKMHDNHQFQKAYATPLVLGGEVISPAADWVYGYDPGTGAERWKVPYGQLGFSNVARPVAGHGMVYVSTCFMKAKLMAISLADHEVVWAYNKGVPKMPSPLVVGDEIYFVDDRVGIATCLDARTGEERWRERLGGNYSASPLYADGKIFFLSQEGKTTVLKPGATCEVLAVNELDGRQMASPAAVDGALYIRTDQALYRIEDR